MEDLPVSASLTANLKASWTATDEVIFIQYITDHKAEAGDGMKFKPSFWTGAATTMAPHVMLGGVKTAASTSSHCEV